MTPSSSGRKYVVERHVSNADKTLDLDADWRSGRLTWRLELDIGSARNFVNALPESASLAEAPLISIQNIQLNSKQFEQTRQKRDRVRSRAFCKFPFPTGCIFGNEAEKRMPTGQCV